MKLTLAPLTKALSLKALSVICFAVVLSSLVRVSYAQQTIPNQHRIVVDSDQWSWKLLSHSMWQSKVGIYFKNQLVNHYLIDCNLGNQAEDLQSDEASQIEKLVSAKNTDGLLLITCMQGAHSKLVQIYDPTRKQNTPVFSQIGAYYAGWLMRDEQLIIYYDQACKTTSKNCQSFERIEFQWPKSQ